MHEFFNPSSISLEEHSVQRLFSQKVESMTIQAQKHYNNYLADIKRYPNLRSIDRDQELRHTAEALINQCQSRIRYEARKINQEHNIDLVVPEISFDYFATRAENESSEEVKKSA